MNQTLNTLVTVYATRDHAAVRACLEGMPRERLIAVVIDLLTDYFNDKNSSTLREWITATLCGYEHDPSKLGYDGSRRNGRGGVQYCEVKPRNCITSPDGGAKPVLSGGGSFNGYTHKRFEKDRKENPTLLMSGFVDGRLIYILEAPFNTPGIVKSVGEKMRRLLPDGDAPSRYVIGGASFAFDDYKDSPDLKVRYVAPLEKLERLADAKPRPITMKLLNFLLEREYPGQSRLFPKKRKQGRG